MEDHVEMLHPNRVILHKNRVSGVSALDCPGTVRSQFDAFDLDKFRENMKIKIIRLAPDLLQFDLVGVDASIANAFRRIMIAEVPTMAIGTAYFLDNTSVIPDEMLSHRIGLLPIKADPSMFDLRESSGGADHAGNTLVFRLHATCSYATKEQQKKSSSSSEGKKALAEEEKFIGAQILSKQLIWLPQVTQLERLQSRKLSKYAEVFQEYWSGRALNAADFSRGYEPVPTRFHGEDRDQYLNLRDNYWKEFPDEIRWGCYPLNENIIVDKLRPGQQLDVQLHIRKGYGRDHAKWTPCVASYRLLPDIIITKPIRGEDADKFAKCFPEGVIGLRNVEVKGKIVKEAYVLDARKDTVSRECLRHPEFQDKVVLSRVRDHYIFNVESIGQYDSPCEIFHEAVKILLLKCKTLKEALGQLESTRAQNSR